MFFNVYLATIYIKDISAKTEIFSIGKLIVGNIVITIGNFLDGNFVIRNFVIVRNFVIIRNFVTKNVVICNFDSLKFCCLGTSQFGTLFPWSFFLVTSSQLEFCY